jgi:hypothetical protein
VQGRFLASLLIILLLILSAPAGLLQPAAAQESVEFVSITATADFPASITFSAGFNSASPVERAQLYWRIIGATATTMAEVTVSGSEPTQLTHIVDTTAQYVPPGVEIEHYWVVSTGDGEQTRSSTRSFTYADTRFEWEHLEAGLINVWWYQGSREYAENVAHSANQTLFDLESNFGLQTGAPIRIWVYSNDRDFSSALRPNSADWIGGVAYSSLSLIIAQIQPGTNAPREIDRMIPHEVSHVVVHHASRNPYNSPPPWLDEGLATFVQRAGDPRLGPILDRAVREGRLIPIGALRSSFPLDSDQALLSYAQSLSVVTYLVETYGTAQVGSLVSVYQTEVSHDAAIESVLGTTMEQLDADWKAWLGYRGDTVDDAFAAASDPPGPARWWFIVGLGGAVAFAVGIIVFFFWRTRQYADITDADTLDTTPPTG